MAENDPQSPSPRSEKHKPFGAGIAFVLATVFGLGALVSGLFTVVALMAPFSGAAGSEEYPKSLPPPPGVESAAPDLSGPVLLLLLFGPITAVLLRACYASLRAGMGKSPVRVITPGLGWVIAIVFGGSTLFACLFAASQGEWGTALEAAAVLPMFLAAPFLAKSLRQRADSR